MRFFCSFFSCTWHQLQHFVQLLCQLVFFLYYYRLVYNFLLMLFTPFSATIEFSSQRILNFFRFLHSESFSVDWINLMRQRASSNWKAKNISSLNGDEKIEFPFLPRILQKPNGYANANAIRIVLCDVDLEIARLFTFQWNRISLFMCINAPLSQKASGDMFVRRRNSPAILCLRFGIVIRINFIKCLLLQSFVATISKYFKCNLSISD